MKRAVLILFLLTMAVPAAFSQKGMAIGELFSSGLEKQPNVVEVIVKGKKLEPYHLTVFRSLTATAHSAMCSIATTCCAKELNPKQRWFTWRERPRWRN